MIEVITALTVLFVVSAALLLLSSRFDFAVIPFYLLTGVLVGGFINENLVLELAQWGIAFLVFIFGIRFNEKQFIREQKSNTLLTVIQLGIVTGITFGIGILLGLGELDAFYLAVAAGLSSSLVGFSYLETDVYRQTTTERLGQSIHYVEDAIGIGILVLLAAFVYSPAEPAVILIGAVGLFVVALAIRRTLFPLIASRVAEDDEVMMLLGISFVVAGIAVAEFIGISIVIGAFAAGLAIPEEFEFDLSLVDTVTDLKAFFMPIFFMTVGALVWLSGLTVQIGSETLLYSTILIVIILILNPIIFTLGIMLKGYPERTAFTTSLRLTHVSEFSLIIAIEALIIGWIASEVFNAVVLAAIVTMFVSSYLIKYDHALYGIVRPAIPDRLRMFGRPSTDEDLQNHIVIISSGEYIDDIVARSSAICRDCLLVLSDPTAKPDENRTAVPWIIGDPTDADVQKRANLESASLVVVTMSEFPTNMTVAHNVNEATVIASAASRKQAEELYAAGADYVVLPHLELLDYMSPETLTNLEKESE